MKKVSPGDPLRISAETFNTFVDAARAFRERGGRREGPVLARGNRSSILPAANITGQFCDSFGIAAITGPVLNPATDLPGFMERTALLAHLPEVPADDGRFVIFLEPVPDGDMGMAVVAGIVPVQIDVVDAAHKYADLKHEDVSELGSRVVGGAEILWKESGTGTKWALIRFPAGASGVQEATTAFPAKIVAHVSGETYTVREQMRDHDTGAFGNKVDTSNISAINLAELVLGDGGAVDVGEVVLTSVLYDDDTPPNAYYAFDHSPYAKYLS